MGDAVEAERPEARIEEDLPSRAGRGIARLHRIEISNQAVQHRRPFPPLVSAKIGKRPANCQTRVEFLVAGLTKTVLQAQRRAAADPHRRMRARVRRRPSRPRSGPSVAAPPARPSFGAGSRVAIPVIGIAAVVIVDRAAILGPGIARLREEALVAQRFRIFGQAAIAISRPAAAKPAASAPADAVAGAAACAAHRPPPLASPRRTLPTGLWKVGRPGAATELARRAMAGRARQKHGRGGGRKTDGFPHRVSPLAGAEDAARLSDNAKGGGFSPPQRRLSSGRPPPRSGRPKRGQKAKGPT